MIERQLTTDAQHDRDAWGREHERSGCTCFLSPPCGHCMHPGHPGNQEGDDCWEPAASLLFAVGDLVLHARSIVEFSDITDAEWTTIARAVAVPAIAERLIALSKRTPYFDLDGYMERGWIYDAEAAGRPERASVRVHHILRADRERDKHNHPWEARTIILKGWYRERRVVDGIDVVTTRRAGDTAPIGTDTFHSIEEVSPGGVWTLFFMSPWKKGWGFDTADGFVPWREYLGVPEGVEG